MALLYAPRRQHTILATKTARSRQPGLLALYLWMKAAAHAVRCCLVLC